ncbi:MAG TPA: pro-sigmaK processing inhibitor BofA family protein [Cerasibacillus sp.]|uniref:pro-sigmaK processing inhibitor BofA family protein n=1 Tax=Cerasibacillus sp. TaxID=2498711 RepID=UPI002F42D2AF
MSPILVISIIIGLIILVLFVGAPLRIMHLIGQSMVKVAIGLLLLFFINLFGGWIGLHVPINLFTVIVSGFLGLFGIVSLTAIHLLILS